MLSKRWPELLSVPEKLPFNKPLMASLRTLLAKDKNLPYTIGMCVIHFPLLISLSPFFSCGVIKRTVSLKSGFYGGKGKKIHGAYARLTCDSSIVTSTGSRFNVSSFPGKNSDSTGCLNFSAIRLNMRKFVLIIIFSQNHFTPQFP